VRLRPVLAARVHLLYDDTKAGVDHTEEWEAIIPIEGESIGLDGAISVDYDDRDLVAEAPPGAVYELPEAPIDAKAFFTDAERDLRGHLYRNQRLAIRRNAALKLYSRPGESDEEFAARCDAAARDAADAEAAKLRGKYEAKIAAVRKRFDAAQRRVAELEVDIQGSRQNELLEGAGALMGILTGRRSTRSVTGSMRRRQSTRSKEQRLATAQEKATTEWDEMAALETELTEELEEINDRWETTADEIEDLEIGLEKTDIHVDDVALLWLPSD
jgi:hypothetical protein